MFKNYSKLFIGLFVCAIVLLLVTKFSSVNTGNVTNPIITDNSKKNDTAKKDPTNNYNHSNLNEGIPEKVLTVLKFIKKNNHAMDGYVGGRVFSNREGILPKQTETGAKIDYQEWDVNPKVQGQNRGAERLCTGNDGRNWYTKNHYKTFTEIKTE